MTLIPPTRKRNRNSEEEDFLPLSKKINNLHINNWGNIDQPSDRMIPWNNTTEQWIAAQQSHLHNGGRKENESRDSSPFENAPENFQQVYSETDLNEHFKHISEDSYQSSSFSQLNFGSVESNSQDGIPQNGWSTTYDPDLSIDENPYYYENNKLLFELYVERLQRGGY